MLEAQGELMLPNDLIHQFKAQIETINTTFNHKIRNLISQEKEDRKSGLLQLGNIYLKTIKQYDLLDNLVNMALIKALDDQKLDELYRLIVIDLEISINDQSSQNNLAAKILKHDNAKDPISREEMLADISGLLKSYEQLTGGPLKSKDINAIICAESEQKFLDFNKMIEALLGSDVPEELSKLAQQIKGQKDLIIEARLGRG